MTKPTKTIFDFTVEEFDTALAVMNAAFETVCGTMRGNFEAHGVTDIRFLNAHTWAENLAGAIEMVEKIRTIHAGKP